MLAKEIKPGTIVNHNSAPCIIESVNVQSPSARGAATIYKYRARNLISKQKVDITLRGGESLARHPEADMPGFVACDTDQWREQKYLTRQQMELRNRAALREGRKVYDRAGE